MYKGICLFSIINSFLPDGAEIIILEKSSKKPAILMADLDADMIPEIIAAYRYQGEVYIIVLKNYYGRWQVVGNIKGKGYDITDMIVAPITNSGINNLIIGWKVASIWSKLDILEWQNNEFKSLIDKEIFFSGIEVGDMEGKEGHTDGKYEIALWVHDTGKAYKIKLYRWNKGKLVDAKDVEPSYFKNVVEYYEQLTKENPKSSTYWYYLADAQIKSGMTKEALKSINEGLELPYPYPSKDELLKMKQQLISNNTRGDMKFNSFNLDILDSKQADVNGDKIEDKVYLLGKKYDSQGAFIQDITLVIMDGKTGAYNKIPLKENAGYNPTIFLGDFTGDKVSDILVNIDSGGSGGYSFSYVYSFLDNKAKLIFDFEKFNDEYKYEVNYRDNYKVDVLSKNFNKKYTLDITDKGNEYLSEIYDENGKLKNELKGYVAAISGVYPIDVERDGTYELELIQKIVGRYNADSLGFVQTTLKGRKNMFVPYNQYVSISGVKETNDIKLNMLPSKEECLIDTSNVKYIYSEDKRDLKLEEAIEKSFGLKKGVDNVRYYYNKIDINDDGNDEVFVYIVGSPVCGTGGCSGAIFKDNKTEYSLISKFTLVNNPIIISDSKTNGFKDIIMYVSGGGIEPFYAILKYDGKTYPLNPSIQPKVKCGEKISGKAIISDDISVNKGIEY